MVLGGDEFAHAGRQQQRAAPDNLSWFHWENADKELLASRDA
jgi:hypothetical protein